MIRLAPLLEELGADPAEVIARSGVDVAILQSPENLISFADSGRLLAGGAAATGLRHFGLLLGRRSGLKDLGLLGDMMRHAPTFGRAILDFAAHQQRDAQGAVTYLALQDGTACWGYGLCAADVEAPEQICEAALAVGASIMQELIEASPQSIVIAHHPPDDLGPYRDCFGVTPQFDAEQYAFHFPAALLDRPVIGASAEERQRLEALVARYRSVPEPGTAEWVLRILRARAVSSEGSLEEVAAALALHPRALGRRLQAEGTSFRKLQAETRFLVSRELLLGTRMRVTDIAIVLGYADQSAFTHAFQQWAGQAPGEWRAAMKGMAATSP